MQVMQIEADEDLPSLSGMEQMIRTVPVHPGKHLLYLSVTPAHTSPFPGPCLAEWWVCAAVS